MGLKYHTVIFVPHARAKFRKLRVSNRQVAIVTGFLAFLTAAATYITWSFFVTEVNLEEISRLRHENENLRTINKSFENSIRTLQNQLSDYEQKTKELAIVAGLEDVATQDVPQAGEAGIGGYDTSYEFTGTDLELLEIEERAEELDERLAQLKEKLDERERYISAKPAIMPVRGLFTSRYGWRRDPITGRRAFHKGIDISAPQGRPVKATGEGIVLKAGPEVGLGQSIFLHHGFGYTTRYGHLSKILVKPGQRVKRGEIVGYVGNTGRSTGNHLHYEVRVDNKPMDPFRYILDIRQY